MTASQGGNTAGYYWVGRRFGDELPELVPDDLETDEWLTLVQRMVEQFINPRDRVGAPMDPGSIDRDSIAAWLRRHFPLMMRLVPKDKFSRFIDGFLEAYAEGDMMDGIGADFLPVEVDLDDPCCGRGYIRIYYHRPRRVVTYQCPAPSCRDASRRAVEEYGSREGVTVVNLGNSIAAVQALSA